MDSQSILDDRHFSYETSILLLEEMAKSAITKKYPCVKKLQFLDKTEDSGLQRKISDQPRKKPVFECLFCLSFPSDRGKLLISGVPRCNVIRT